MVLNGDQITYLLRGDLSNIKEFKESDNNEEDIDFLNAFSDMGNFMYQNDLELNNLVNLILILIIIYKL
jgi:hypothetical protein